VGDEFGGTSDSYNGGATVNGILGGTYTLKLTKTGYKDWTEEITIAAGETTTVTATMSPSG
jgi:hypothetical protein